MGPDFLAVVWVCEGFVGGVEEFVRGGVEGEMEGFFGFLREAFDEGFEGGPIDCDFSFHCRLCILEGFGQWRRWYRC